MAILVLYLALSAATKCVGSFAVREWFLCGSLDQIQPLSPDRDWIVHESVSCRKCAPHFSLPVSPSCHLSCVPLDDVGADVQSGARVYFSSTLQLGQHIFEPLSHCHECDQGECEQLCTRTPSCESWRWQCTSNGSSCCTYSSLSPIFREASACGWAGHGPVAGPACPTGRQDVISLSECSKVVVAPHGYTVALELPTTQEQYNVGVTVYDGLTAASPTLRPSDEGIIRSSGRNLRVAIDSTSTHPPILCAEKAAWRARIELEEQRMAPAPSAAEGRIALTRARSPHWTWHAAIVPAVAIAVILWSCCGFAYYIYLSGVEAAIFTGASTLTWPRGQNDETEPNVRETRFANRRVELGVSDVVRHGPQTSDLHATLRSYSFALPTPSAIDAGSTIGECTICLCEIVPLEEATRLRCSHTYHSTCVEAWATRAATCPVCRAPIATKEPDPTTAMQQRRPLVPLSSASSVASHGNQNVADATGGDWIRNPLFELHIAATER